MTAINTAPSGVAILAEAGPGPAGKATIDLTNVIARVLPGGAGLKVRTDSSGAGASIQPDHSNWLGSSFDGTNTAITIGIGSGNQNSAPAFVDLAAGDYRQAPGSPTIDAGLYDPANGTFDVDGDQRSVGATDIGANEFVIAPVATTGPAGAVTARSATLTGSVAANGAPTTYRFEYGPTTAYGGTTPTTGAGSGTGAVAAAATLDGLRAGATYHYRLVALNGGGVSRGGTGRSPRPRRQHRRRLRRSGPLRPPSPESRSSRPAVLRRQVRRA